MEADTKTKKVAERHELCINFGDPVNSVIEMLVDIKLGANGNNRLTLTKPDHIPSRGDAQAYKFIESHPDTVEAIGLALLEAAKLAREAK